MSHFSRVKTKMVDRELLVLALQDLGYSCEEGNYEIQDYYGNKTPVEIRLRHPKTTYAMGFYRTDDAYTVVADWMEIRTITRDDFIQQVIRRYAYNSVRSQMEAQGSVLADEETQQDGQIRLVLRHYV